MKPNIFKIIVAIFCATIIFCSCGILKNNKSKTSSSSDSTGVHKKDSTAFEYSDTGSKNYSLETNEEALTVNFNDYEGGSDTPSVEVNVIPSKSVKILTNIEPISIKKIATGEYVITPGNTPVKSISLTTQQVNNQSDSSAAKKVKYIEAAQNDSSSVKKKAAGESNHKFKWNIPWYIYAIALLILILYLYQGGRFDFIPLFKRKKNAS